ncbi:serine/threonine-protein kinase [Dorcoceras hygrometricum]|uniref:Serine/threonine-protein kinase n=1 Tax=Dorcoceras hygrometricum TaxID=472368 RepID=A0A2Z7AP81_9LAMI|nr:serine/threonine-protein kinase [Dorcoceras hygrometricum]
MRNNRLPKFSSGTGETIGRKSQTTCKLQPRCTSPTIRPKTPKWYQTNGWIEEPTATTIALNHGVNRWQSEQNRVWLNSKDFSTVEGITSTLPSLLAGIRHTACTTRTDYTASTEQLLDSVDHATRQIIPITHSSAYHQPTSKLVSLDDVAPPPAQDNQLAQCNFLKLNDDERQVAEIISSSKLPQARSRRSKTPKGKNFKIDSDLVIYRTALLRTFQVVTICRVDKSKLHSRCQHVCIAIGSLATLDLPMVVDRIGIYGLKGPYSTLTTTDWFLQALSVIPRGSWADVC